MQIRSCPFWLMMVSTTRAVLPVCRSPMINSRCPRPIGIMASIALMPVWTGMSTLLRLTTLGAMRSMGRKLSDSIGPLPSTGWPTAFTARPIMPLPTGTETMRPVLRTNCPSAMPTLSPMIMTPTFSASRLKTMPRVPLSNSTSSEARALVRPLRRAIPSPTDSTVPTSTVRVGAWNARICCLSWATKSSVRTAIDVPLFT